MRRSELLPSVVRSRYLGLKPAVYFVCLVNQYWAGFRQPDRLHPWSASPRRSECAWQPKQPLHSVNPFSAASLSQCRALMRCDMVSLVTLDLILRIILAGVARVPLVVEVFRMHLDDLPADVPGL